jgi:hypothetical protein
MSGALLLESRDGDTLDMQLSRTAARVSAEELAADQPHTGGERQVTEEPRHDGAAAPLPDEQDGDNDGGVDKS